MTEQLHRPRSEEAGLSRSEQLAMRIAGEQDPVKLSKLRQKLEAEVARLQKTYDALPSAVSVLQQAAERAARREQELAGQQEVDELLGSLLGDRLSSIIGDVAPEVSQASSGVESRYDDLDFSEEQQAIIAKRLAGEAAQATETDNPDQTESNDAVAERPSDPMGGLGDVAPSRIEALRNYRREHRAVSGVASLAIASLLVGGGLKVAADHEILPEFGDKEAIRLYEQDYSEIKAGVLWQDDQNVIRFKLDESGKYAPETASPRPLDYTAEDVSLQVEIDPDAITDTAVAADNVVSLDVSKLPQPSVSIEGGNVSLEKIPAEYFNDMIPRLEEAGGESAGVTVEDLENLRATIESDSARLTQANETVAAAVASGDELRQAINENLKSKASEVLAKEFSGKEVKIECEIATIEAASETDSLPIFSVDPKNLSTSQEAKQ